MFASQVAEHACNGERLWIAKDSPFGMSWKIGEDYASLLEVIDRIPGSMFDWAIDQTLAALGEAAPTDQEYELFNAADIETEERVLGLLTEFLRLAHISDVVADRLGLIIDPQISEQPLANAA